MSIFSKPVSDLGPQDLQDLLDRQAIENVRLEFKRAIPTKDETLKKLSSFANRYGGYVVIGADASSADGRIAGLPGVEAQPSYKQTVVQWCFDGVSPPLTVAVSDPIESPADTGKVCYVLHVPESDLAPHFLNARKGVYVRTDEFSGRFEALPATEAELRYLFDRRKPIFDRRAELLRRAKRRFRAHADRSYQEAMSAMPAAAPPETKEARSYFELSVVPRYPAQTLCEQQDLRPHIRNSALAWRGTQFPLLLENAVSQHESAIQLDPCGCLSILEANVWGMLFYATEIQEEIRGRQAIHPFQFVGYVLLFVKHAARMLPKIGYSGALVVDMTLQSIGGVPWTSSGGSGPSSQLDDEASFGIETTSDVLAENPDRIAMDLLRYSFFATNWPDAVHTQQRLQNLVLEGYRFNFWPLPPALPA
jgi:hypothetical protein